MIRQSWPVSRQARAAAAAIACLTALLLAPAAAMAQCAGTTCTLYASGDAEKDTAQLEAALNHNPGGARVVELNGTFELTRNVYVNYDDTTIRGQGKLVGPPFVFWPNTWQPHVGLRIWGGEHVSWTSTAGVSLAGSTLTKTTPDAWDGTAVSTRALQAGSDTTPILSGDGYVEFTPGPTDTYRLIGLNHVSRSKQQPVYVDFALYMDAWGNLYVIEGGFPVGWLGWYETSDRLRVSVEDGRIRYRRNGFLLYQSAVLPQYPLVAGAALYSQGATLRDVVLAGSVVPWSHPADYPRRVKPGETRFDVATALAPQDLVMVWNFPSDNVKRRKEFTLAAAGTTSLQLSVQDPTLFEYQEGVSFTKIAPRRRVTIEGVTLDTLAVNLNMARDFTIKDLAARRVGFRASACYSCDVLNLDFDARGDDPNPGTSAAVDFGEASRHVTIAGGSYRHYRGFEEPGPIKLNQTSNSLVRDLTIEDVRTVMWDHSWSPDGRPIFALDPRAKMSGIMIDTNVGKNATGYTDVPSVGVTISNVTADDADYGIFATTFAHTPIKDLKILRYNRRYSDGAGVYIRGCEDVVLQDLMLPNVDDVLRIESSQRVLVLNTDSNRYVNRVFLQDLGRIFPEWGTRRNTDITFQGVQFMPKSFVPYSNVFLPIFYDVDDLRLSDVRFVLAGWTAAPLGAAWFNLVKNVTARNVTVFPITDAPLWSWGVVQGFFAGNSTANFDGTARWPPQYDVPSHPAGEMFNVAGEPDWSYYSDGTNYCRYYPATSATVLPARPYNMGYAGECSSSVGAFRVSDFTYYSSGQSYCMIPPGASLPTPVYTFSKYPSSPYTGYCN